MKTKTRKMWAGHYAILIKDSASITIQIDIIRSSNGTWYVKKHDLDTMLGKAAIADNFKTKREAVQFASRLNGADYMKLYRERYAS